MRVECRSFVLAALLAPLGCDKGGSTRAPGGDVTFGSAPARVGDTSAVAYKATLQLSYTEPKAQIGPVTIQLEYGSERTDTVQKVKDGLAAAVSAKYARAREYWGGTEGTGDEPLDVAGQTYLVESDGDVRASRLDGDDIGDSSIDDHLERDFELLGSPGSLRAQLRGKTITPGASLEVTPGEVSAPFPDAEGDLLQLTLKHLGSKCGRDVAFFEAKVPVTVWFRRFGARADFEGTIALDIETGAAVELDLAGPVTLVDGNGRTGPGADFQGEGKAALTKTVSPGGTCR